MNIERLKLLVESLISDEKEFSIQQHLSSLNDALQNYANSPTDSNQQVEFSNRSKKLSEQLIQLISKYDPPQIAQFEEIGAMEFFSPRLSEEIQRMVSENPMTPAVVHQGTQKLTSRRNKYISNIQSLSSSLSALGFEGDELEEGETEIGFQIPRDIFNNDLEGLISELRVLRRVIRAFAEVAHGTVEQIEVRQISTSDPIFFFGLGLETIVKIGGAITWALVTWKKVEEIRNLRSQTARNTAFTQEEIQRFFDEKVTNIIEEAVEEKTKDLIANHKKSGREHEQSIDLKWSLRALLERVERGMTVEIRFLPPQSEPETDENGEGSATKTSSNGKHYAELKEIVPNLSFPKAENSPILQLSKIEDPAGKKK